MSSSRPLWDSLKLDHTVSSELRIRTWERDEPTLAAGAPTAHEAVELTIVEAGSVVYTAGGQELHARSGDVVIVPHGVEHTTTFPAHVRGLALWIGAETVRELADDLGPDFTAPLGSPRVLPLTSDRVQRLVSVLHGEVREGAVGHARAAQAITESIVIEVLRRLPRDPRGERDARRDPRIAAAVAHMRAALHEPLRLDDLARAANMSRFHFSRAFRDALGEAPYQYLIRLRVARASELLRSGRCSVTEAGLAAGFSDLSRFTRTFKEHVGQRPVDVLRAARSAKH